MRKISILFFTLLNFCAFSQSVSLYSDDFESASSFSFIHPVTTNTWRIATCAGNGTSSPGSMAMYASKGGANPGCGTDGQDQYAFSAAPVLCGRLK